MEQDFVFYEQRKSCHSLILFVHGFIGDVEKTWTNKNGQSFQSLIMEKEYIAEHFDVASYSYFTTLLTLFADSKEKARFIKNLIRKITHKKEI